MTTAECCDTAVAAVPFWKRSVQLELCTSQIPEYMLMGFNSHVYTNVWMKGRELTVKLSIGTTFNSLSAYHKALAAVKNSCFSQSTQHHTKCQYMKLSMMK